jgi:hypothetical protein
MKIPRPRARTNCEPTIELVLPLLSNPVRIARGQRGSVSALVCALSAKGPENGYLGNQY